MTAKEGFLRQSGRFGRAKRMADDRVWGDKARSAGQKNFPHEKVHGSYNSTTTN